MSLLLDTHAALWFFQADSRLPASTRERSFGPRLRSINAISAGRFNSTNDISAEASPCLSRFSNSSNGSCMELNRERKAVCRV